MVKLAEDTHTVLKSNNKTRTFAEHPCPLKGRPKAFNNESTNRKDKNKTAGNRKQESWVCAMHDDANACTKAVGD